MIGASGGQTTGTALPPSANATWGKIPAPAALERPSMAATSSAVELDPYAGRVGSNALRAHRLRDHHEAVRGMPGDNHLRGRRVVSDAIDISVGSFRLVTLNGL